MARTAGSGAPIGATLGDGAFVVTERLHGDAARALHRGVDARGDRGGARVLVTLTGLQRRPLEEVRAALELPVAGVARLLHVERLAGPPSYDALVEEEPAGVPAAMLPLPWAPGDVARLVAALAELAERARASGHPLDGWQPELVYVARDADGALSLAGVAPRALAFAAGAELPARAVGPLFAHTFAAPERLALRPGGPAADVFSLCALAALWLSGAHPFEGDTAQRQLISVMTGRRRRWGGPAAWEALVARGVALRPDERMDLVELRAAVGRV